MQLAFITCLDGPGSRTPGRQSRMSSFTLTSDVVNYLIYRYLQEAGEYAAKAPGAILAGSGV